MPDSRRCDRCGGQAVWRYGKDGCTPLDLCHTCSVKHEDALADKGWRVLVA